MPKINVYDMNGKVVGDIELADGIFGIKPNKAVMHELVKNHLANMRQGTQSTKTRAEVSGGGAKPWRQKGTGRARQGSTRSPQWVHGGIAFGPKPRTYTYSVNKKIRRLALKSALSSKVLSEDVIIVENLNMTEIKTKDFAKFLNAVNAPEKALIVTPELNQNVYKSARNIPGVKTTMSNLINVYDILNCKKLVIDKDAVLRIQEVYA